MRVQRQYNEAFRQQALEKVYTRGSNSVRAVAEELNMSKGTLRNWMKADQNNSPTRTEPRSRRPKDWSRAERLKILMESHGLDEAALNAFCREGKSAVPD